MTTIAVGESIKENVVFLPINGNLDSYKHTPVTQFQVSITTAHKEKIKLSDEVWIVHKTRYWGMYTKEEIRFSKSINKKIRYITLEDYLKMFSYERYLKMFPKKKITKNRTLRKRLLRYLDKSKLSLRKIRKHPKVNLTGVGRCSLEKLINSGEISAKLEIKLVDFLNKENM